VTIIGITKGPWYDHAHKNYLYFRPKVSRLVTFKIMRHLKRCTWKDYIEIIWQKQEKNGDNWSSISMELWPGYIGKKICIFLLFTLSQSLKWKLEFTGPKQIIEFIYIVLNKNWKIYWSKHSFTGHGLDFCGLTDM
jgi:hypothetical protein